MNLEVVDPHPGIACRNPQVLAITIAQFEIANLEVNLEVNPIELEKIIESSSLMMLSNEAPQRSPLMSSRLITLSQQCLNEQSLSRQISL